MALEDFVGILSLQGGAGRICVEGSTYQFVLMQSCVPLFFFGLIKELILTIIHFPVMAEA